MSYAESRDAGQLDRLRIATLQFVERWQARPPGSKRRTLFLFPGGLGSNLFRATLRERADHPVDLVRGPCLST